MKIALITDTHWGVRNDNVAFLDNSKRFLDEIFFPSIRDNGISTVIHLGDLVDRRKYININTARRLREDFLIPMREHSLDVHIIAGNHDLNLSNMNRLDSLTPLVNSINHSNLWYLKHSGVYTVGDTDLAVYSILDDKELWPSYKDCESKKKIALYHGPVHGAQTDARYVITNRHVEVSLFNGFDMVLLGDIHKRQEMQSPSGCKVVYAGSLLQQNFGETLNEHGFLVWDLETLKYESVDIQNDYG